jgi:hypothetical protein
LWSTPCFAVVPDEDVKIREVRGRGRSISCDVRIPFFKEFYKKQRNIKDEILTASEYEASG